MIRRQTTQSQRQLSTSFKTYFSSSSSALLRSNGSREDTSKDSSLMEKGFEQRKPPSEDENQAHEEGKGKSLAERDAELKARMAGLAGDGGEAGLELEDGKPASMKRGVKQNMFRYI